MKPVRHRVGGATVRVALVLAATAALHPAQPAGAQSRGNGFLFGPARGAVTLRGGFDRANSGSDIFSFVTRQLTIDKSDFRSSTLGGDVAVNVGPRLAVLVGTSFSRTKTPSEFRDWLDNRDLPITQTTSFSRVPVTAGLKLALTAPGQSIGRLAWIPARYTPYVGAGGGVMHYRFEQSGDFIDFDTTRVFFDEFSSKGWTPTGHAFAGLDVSLSPRFVFTTEARYEWARTKLGADFAGFDPIDLSGVKMTAGFSIRY